MVFFFLLYFVGTTAATLFGATLVMLQRHRSRRRSWEPFIVGGVYDGTVVGVTFLVVVAVVIVVIVFAELEKFKMLLEAQKNDLIDSFTGELDKRNVGGDSFLANGILE